MKKEWIFLGIGSAIIIAAVVLVCTFIGGPMSVEGSSMNPYLVDGDVVIIDKLAYSDEKVPERYDIIVFPYRYDERQKYVKRVIGLPGEIIELIDDDIYIEKDGIREKLIDGYGSYSIKLNATSQTTNYLSDYGPIELGEDEYFVLGDNRYDSKDSRAEDVGVIKLESIIGKITFRVFPLSAFGTLG